MTVLSRPRCARVTPFLLGAAIALPAAAQMLSPLRPANPASVVRPADPMTSIPKLTSRIGETRSELVEIVEEYTADQSSLSRRYDAPDSPEQRRRMREFSNGWRTRLKEIAFDKLSQEGEG